MGLRLSKLGGRVWLAVFFGAAAVGLFFIFTRYNPLNSELRKIQKQEKLMQEALEREKNDTYGGFTPEETLRLFIDALKQGDTDLAAKYFALDKQEEWREDLAGIKDKGKGLMDNMIRDLEREKYKNKISDSMVTFSIANDNNEVSLTILVKKVSNNRWKIEDF